MRHPASFEEPLRRTLPTLIFIAATLIAVIPAAAQRCRGSTVTDG